VKSKDFGHGKLRCPPYGTFKRKEKAEPRWNIFDVSHGTYGTHVKVCY
jgi:hypothetical protein